MKYHFIGVCGTGMGALAGLLQKQGHEVRGSDVQAYPPMSDQLATLGIEVFEGYGGDNLSWGPDCVVVGNVCSKDHVEVLAAQSLGLPLKSFPQVLGEEVLENQHSFVVTGTHGKTTTTSILAHLLQVGKREPGWLIGGVPLNYGQGARVGGGNDFVVEGDEYDSAFFDKGSKFLHYRPRTAILTSIELDHVDIFSGIEAITASFEKFVALMPPDGLLIVNHENRLAMEVASQANCRIESYAVDTGNGSWAEPPTWVAKDLEYLKNGRCKFAVYRNGELFERFETLMAGRYNVGNIVATIAAAHGAGVSPGDLVRGVSSFAGIRRRQEIRGVAQGVYILDDYAHHPTAVRETLLGLRQRFKKRRIVAVYEPRSATSRRNVFQKEYVEAFSPADQVFIGKLHDTSKINDDEQFDPGELVGALKQQGMPAAFVPDTDELVGALTREAAPGNVVAIMSSGSFDGLHDKLLGALGDAVRPGRVGDIESVRLLLKDLGLPTEQVTSDSLVDWIVLQNETGFTGCVALQVLGEDAVLHSLAVKPDSRGVGYGWLLADTAITVARHRGVKRIYLLTEDASDFFAAKHGFRKVDRSIISEEVLASQSFTHAHSVLAVAMRLDL